MNKKWLITFSQRMRYQAECSTSTVETPEAPHALLTRLTEDWKNLHGLNTSTYFTIDFAMPIEDLDAEPKVSLQLVQEAIRDTNAHFGSAGNPTIPQWTTRFMRNLADTVGT